MIGLHKDNVVDDALCKFPAKEKQRFDKRYSSLITDVAGLKFIGRLVADSRIVALNHTVGLSVPRQLQMTLCRHMGIDPRSGPNLH